MTSVLLAYILTVGIFLILPSPIDLVIMDGAHRHGFKGAFFSVMATNAASLIWIAAAGLMLAGIGQINDQALNWLTAAGGAYLVYYGISLWREAKQTHILDNNNANTTPKSLKKIMLHAFGVGLSSPKDIIFFMTFFPPFIGQLNIGLINGLLLLTLIWCIMDYLILIAYGMGLAKWLTPARETVVYRLSGITFITIGLYAVFHTLKAT